MDLGKVQHGGGLTGPVVDRVVKTERVEQLPLVPVDTSNDRSPPLLVTSSSVKHASRPTGTDL
jgi:hypothetical protein